MKATEMSVRNVSLWTDPGVGFGIAYPLFGLNRTVMTWAEVDVESTAPSARPKIIPVELAAAVEQRPSVSAVRKSPASIVVLPAITFVIPRN